MSKCKSVSPSSDNLQATLDQIFTVEMFPLVGNIADDIVVVRYMEDGSDHDANLWLVFSTARREGMEFNPNKYIFKLAKIPLFGMVFSNEGMIPDQKKTETLSNLPFPSNVKEMQSFLGVCYYLGRFISQHSSWTLP